MLLEDALIYAHGAPGTSKLELHELHELHELQLDAVLVEVATHEGAAALAIRGVSIWNSIEF